MTIKGSSGVGSSVPSYPQTTITSVETNQTFEQKAITEKQFSRKDLEREVENLNKFLQSSNTHLKFTLHERLNEYYVQVIDEENNVVREIPSKKIMDMVANMYETLGIIVDERR